MRQEARRGRSRSWDKGNRYKAKQCRKQGEVGALQVKVQVQVQVQVQGEARQEVRQGSSRSRSK